MNGGIVSIHFSSYTCSLHPHCGESLEVTSPFLPSANQTWIAGKHGKPYLVRRWSVIFFVNLHLARWFIICFPLFKPPFSLMLLPFKNDYYKGFFNFNVFFGFWVPPISPISLVVCATRATQTAGYQERGDALGPHRFFAGPDLMVFEWEKWWIWMGNMVVTWVWMGNMGKLVVKQDGNWPFGKLT